MDYGKYYNQNITSGIQAGVCFEKARALYVLGSILFLSGSYFGNVTRWKANCVKQGKKLFKSRIKLRFGA